MRSGRAGQRRPHRQAVPDLRQRGTVPARRRGRPRAGDEYFAGLRSSLRSKRDLLCDGLEKAGFAVDRPDGTYFATADIRPLGETDGLAFCRALPERCGVVAVPSQVFYQDPERGRHLVRFTFCKRDEVLGEAAARLAAL